MRLLSCLAALLVCGCVTVPTEQWVELPRADWHHPARLKINDVVRVHKGDHRYVFRVTELGADAFRGVARDRKTYRTPFAAIEALEVLRRGSHEVVFWDSLLGTAVGGVMADAAGRSMGEAMARSMSP